VSSLAKREAQKEKEAKNKNGGWEEEEPRRFALLKQFRLSLRQERFRRVSFRERKKTKISPSSTIQIFKL
jgi:hypothetical protein